MLLPYAPDAPISIHALRVEGDCRHQTMLPTGCISIHALRVEGDGHFTDSRSGAALISIHALRVEGDLKCQHFGRKC